MQNPIYAGKYVWVFRLGRDGEFHMEKFGWSSR